MLTILVGFEMLTISESDLVTDKSKVLGKSSIRIADFFCCKDGELEQYQDEVEHA